MRFLARLEGLYREGVQLLKPVVRAGRRTLSLSGFRLRRLLGIGPPATVVAARVDGIARPAGDPAIRVLAGAVEPGELERFLDRQTETSWTTEGDDATFLFSPEGDLDRLPDTHLEALLLVAAALDLDLVVSAEIEGEPEERPPLPRGAASREASRLLRLPTRERRRGRAMGARIGHVGPGVGLETDRQGWSAGGLPEVGRLLLPFDDAPRGVVRQPVQDVRGALAALPARPGPPTVLFLLPYLAVGGAEHLLFDLLVGLEDLRAIVVTTEPHRSELGQTVDRAQELTPHVYTLGDWLPREAHGGAIRHLVRRYGVETLFCWNGCSWFYDEAPALKRELPALHLVNQLYSHSGGWMSHVRPSMVRAVDCHVAVNRRTAEALRERGVPPERLRLVHHGVEVPELPSDEERRRRREARRRELGLPLGAVVVGTFVRLHRQKRPLDVVRLARRLEKRGLWFLLVGGGPLDETVDREIAADPPPNLLRLPMRRDPQPLYDALDLCLLTSSFEGLPVFLLEGLARGLPCVATAVGDVPLLLAEGGGSMAEPGDLDRLEGALLELLDAEKRREEGRRGRQRVALGFGLERYRKAYLEPGLLRAGGGDG